MARYSTATYSDIDLDLTKLNDGDVQRDTDINAVSNSIQNIVETMQGSRRMLPEFASQVYGLLFEPMDEVTEAYIGQGIIEILRRWDNRITIEKISVNFNPDNAHAVGYYTIHLNYILRSNPSIQSIKFILRQK